MHNDDDSSNSIRRRRPMSEPMVGFVNFHRSNIVRHCNYRDVLRRFPWPVTTYDRTGNVLYHDIIFSLPRGNVSTLLPYLPMHCRDDHPSVHRHTSSFSLRTTTTWWHHHFLDHFVLVVVFVVLVAYTPMPIDARPHYSDFVDSDIDAAAAAAGPAGRQPRHCYHHCV